MRIVSFLPAGTEIVCALGLGEKLVGVSHECDYPPEARAKPAVVRPALPLEGLTQREIDEKVSQRLRDGWSLYDVDERLLHILEPDVIITQDLCQVCAPSGNETAAAVRFLPKRPEILHLTPHSLAEIFDNVREVGRVCDRAEAADALIATMRSRLDRIAQTMQRASARPRVFCMEWLDPVYCSGHWVPEMVELAGGVDSLSRKRADSIRISWDEVREWDPEVLVLMPCGYRLSHVLALARHVFRRPGWAELSAVRNRRVYAVDANAYFARPGPRVVEGTELLAHLIHPELFEWSGGEDDFAPVADSRSQATTL